MTKIKRLILFGLALVGAAFSAHGTNFPTTVSSDSNLYIAKNNCGAVLSAAITSGAATVSVNDTTCFPTVGYVTIDEEALLCTGKTGTTFTGCTRGADSTTAASHVSGSGAYQFIIAAHHNVLKDELISISTTFLQGSQFRMDFTNTRLGIGTASPSTALHVVGAGTFTGQILGTSGSGSAPGLSFSSDPNTGIFNSGADQMDFTTGGSAHWQMSSAGALTSYQTSATNERILNSSGSATVPTYSFASDGGTGMGYVATSGLRFLTGGSERMRIDSSGFIGMATTAPQTQLHVNAQSGIVVSNTDCNFSSVGTYGQLSLGAGSGNTYTRVQSFNSGGGAGGILALNSLGGTVGVGTSVPASLLHVHAGTLQLTNASTGLTSSDGFQIETTGGTTEARLIQKENDAMVLYTNNTERLRIMSGGEVLIGTATSKSSNLGIYGTASYGIVYKNPGVDSNAWFRLENDARDYLLGVRGDSSDSFVIYDDVASANRFTISSTGIFGFSSTATNGTFNFLSADNTTAMMIQINATQANVTTSDKFVGYYSTSGEEGNVAGTAVAGVIAFNTFTGSHWTRIAGKKKPEVLAPLCSTGDTFSTKEQLVRSEVCAEAKSKRVIGFYGGTDDSGNDMAFALGTGFAWVLNTGADTEIGDWFFTTGDGLTVTCQDDDLQHNFSAAKALQPIKWKAGEKKRRIAVTYHAG